MPLPRAFTFIRHGQTDWNVQDRFQGAMDIPLNATGIDQAQAAGQLLANHPFDAAITSPLGRTRHTADLVLAGHPTPLPLHTHAGLRERSMGAWEGRLRHELWAEHGLPQGHPSTDAYLPPDAETWAQTEARALATVQEILATHTGELLLISHGGIFRALMRVLTDTVLHTDNCVPYRIEKHAGVWRATAL
ncbi:MAG: histidine phosphatase family protein [Alphaproteobacteria bacterium]